MFVVADHCNLLNATRRGWGLFALVDDVKPNKRSHLGPLPPSNQDFSTFHLSIPAMTINSVRTLATDRAFPALPDEGTSDSSPHIYGAPDFPFKGWQPPQPEGYKQSAATSHESAIVIDNGQWTISTASTSLILRCRLKHHQSRIFLRQDPSFHGPSYHGSLPRSQE
jgi:hypothetical protein